MDLPDHRVLMDLPDLLGHQDPLVNLAHPEFLEYQRVEHISSINPNQATLADTGYYQKPQHLLHYKQ
jgi:hypothetical protein